MALIWADNFEMYGTTADMLNGVYGSISDVSIRGEEGDRYLHFGAGGSASPKNILYPLSAPTLESGQGFFIYFESLPQAGDERPNFGAFYQANGTPIIDFRVLATGQIVVYRNETEIHTTPTPVVTANADIHWESKIKVDPLEGSVEVRIRGRSVILLENIDTGSTPVALHGFFNRASFVGYAISYRIKHWTHWDTLGAVNNDFLGQVMVYWNKPVLTREAGGWVSSAGALPHETVDKPTWANQLTASGNIVNNDTVRIDNVYYRWTLGSVATGAGTSANPWLVTLGVDTATSLQNMYDAINATGIPGTTYTPTLVEHPLVKAFGIISTAFCVIPKVEGTTTMSFSETGAATAWDSTSTFLYRVWDTIRMSANYTPAVKAQGSLTFTGLPTADQTVTVGGQTYTFKASAVAPLEVSIGTTPEETATNLATAITANSSSASPTTNGAEVALEAISAGVSGNTIVLATSSSSVSVSGATLTGGVDITYPDPFVLGLTPLPDDVTSIRAVIPVVRAAKLDGGDGNIQVSFGTLDTNYDVGPDTPITNAMTYWGNATDPFVSEINPDTGTPWTPGEFNLGARVKVARTK